MPSTRTPISGRSKIIRQLLGTMAHSPRRANQIARDFSTLRQSSLFDHRFYLRQNPGVAEAEMNPVLHYVAFGVAEGLDPSPAFGTESYLRAHPHLRRSGTNPLAHLERLNARRSDSGAGSSSSAGADGPTSTTSVIVISGGARQGLTTAVRSALSQTQPPLEVIVCDESPDGAGQPVLEKSFAAEMDAGAVRWLQGDPTLRHSARNDGVEQARGELIAYLCDGDEWNSDYLRTLGDAFARDEAACVARAGTTEPVAGEATGNPVEISEFAHRRRLYTQLGGFDDSLGDGAPTELTTLYSRCYSPVPGRDTLEVVLFAHSSGGRRAAALAKPKVDLIHRRTKTPFTLTVLADTGDPTFAARLQLAVAGRQDVRLLLLSEETWHKKVVAQLARENEGDRVVCLTLTKPPDLAEGWESEPRERPAFLPEAAPPLRTAPTCNLCGSPDATFVDDGRPGICSVCKSTPFGRTAFSHLVGLPLLRGLRCGVDIIDDRALAEQLERMFDVVPLVADEPGDGGLPLAIVDLGSRPAGELAAAVATLGTAVRPDGVVIVGAGGEAANSLASALKEAEFEIQRSSGVAGGDPTHAVVIAQRSERVHAAPR